MKNSDILFERTRDDYIQVGTAIFENGFDVEHLVLRDSFTGHTFITGATGTGKTNAICTILEQVRNYDCPFMVIDARHGEYKKLLAEWDDVYIFNVVPGETSPLKINPFSFPIGLHIRDHIAWLMDIFNVCFELSLTMSLILRVSIERSYEEFGWDIETSEWKRTRYGNGSTFPDFASVLNQMKQILDLDFNPDNIKELNVKPLYQKLKVFTGSLFGNVFAAEETPISSIYETNVIIDISRVPSAELKGLITGFMVMKMEEERTSYQTPNNGELNHITVLEDASHFLKKPNVTHFTTNADLMNNSVEMIVNAITDMGSYGEGFIFSSRYPGDLNQAAIQNTKQKIFFRVVGKNDRELLQHVSHLTNDQLHELLRLKNGEALVKEDPRCNPQLCIFSRFDEQKEWQ